MKWLRNFFRHIRNGFRNLFRNPWMTLTSLVTMTIALLLIGGLSMLLMNVDNISRDLESGIQIRTYIDISASPEDERNLQAEIEAIEHVIQTTYRSKDEELADLIENVGEEFELFQADNNPLFNVIVVSVDSPDNLSLVSEQIDQLAYTSEVSYGELDADRLLETLNLARILLAFIAAVMVIIAVVLIANAIKVSIYSRQSEIEIMRLVGAEASYIRAPFVYEGSFIGIISALIATGLLYAIYDGLIRASVEIIGFQIIRFTPTFPYVLYVGLLLLVIGIILGILGARRSVKRFVEY